MDSVEGGASITMLVAEEEFVTLAFLQFPAGVSVLVVHRCAFCGTIIIVMISMFFLGGSFGNMTPDRWMKGVGELTCFDASLHVIKIDKLVIYV